MSTRKTGKEFAVTFTAKEKAELVQIEPDKSLLKSDEVVARTLVSLVSNGTEVAGCYSGSHFQIAESSYPLRAGYASVSQVEDIGSEVKGFSKGDLVLGGGHQSFQRSTQNNFFRIPDGLSPENAVFARMIKISMPAFVRSTIRPPEILVITGLGLVGLMAAQVGQTLGYSVVACDPNEKRRQIAQQHGVQRIMAVAPLTDPNYAKKAGFGLECSGHEQATLDLCNIVRVWGEVALVGVPWVPRTSMLAQKILHAVFYNYVDLKSGWEGQMPTDPNIHSPAHHFSTACQWLAEGKIRVDQCAYRRISPVDPQRQYQDLLHNRLEELTVMFDWREL